MTADHQSLPPINSHSFLTRRHREPFMGSGDSFSVVKPLNPQKREGAAQPLNQISSGSNENGQASAVSHESGPYLLEQSLLEQSLLEQSLLDALRQRIALAVSLQTLLMDTVADMQQELQVDRVLILPMGDRASLQRILTASDEIEADDVGGDDVGGDDVETDEIEADDVEADDVGSDDVGGDDVEADEIEADEIEASESMPLDLPPLVSGPIESYAEAVPSVVEYAQHNRKSQGGNPIWTITDVEHRAYIQGQVDVVRDSASPPLLPPQRTLLEVLAVKSYVNLPIVIHQDLWGLLMVQCCEKSRDWSSFEIGTLNRLVQQIAIAIEQAMLRQQYEYMRQTSQGETKTQPFSSIGSTLALQDRQPDTLRHERMAPLKQSLKFAELVLEVTERIRDSLDETQILQTATRELAKALSVNRCKIELYDPSLAIATVAYEHALMSPNCIGMTRKIADFPEVYEPLFHHQPIQFVVPPSSTLRLVNMTRLACPIFDDQGALGNLWLFRPRNEMFNRWEVRIVQQIANECAIAIRQARLYEASQQQIRELERLSQLKDDFLKTISHELRTPLSSIILGIQTLERILDQAPDAKDQPTIQRLFRTVHMECHRENKLIEDLLTFCYLEAGKESLMATAIDLNRWLLDIIKPFEIRIQNQQQHLTVKLSNLLPPLNTELAYLERIVSELLNNACKYTPPHEHIIISTTLKYVAEDTAEDTDQSSGDGVEYIVLTVKNSGIEIPEEEQERIFDKFYRIPCSDPWQYGGTGLGLALVKKLTQCLGASIKVASMDGQTKFVVLFPVGGTGVKSLN